MLHTSITDFGRQHFYDHVQTALRFDVIAGDCREVEGSGHDAAAVATGPVDDGRASDLPCSVHFDGGNLRHGRDRLSARRPGVAVAVGGHRAVLRAGDATQRRPRRGQPHGHLGRRSSAADTGGPDVGGSTRVRVFEVPALVGRPDPACWAQQPDHSCRAALSSARSAPRRPRRTRARSTTHRGPTSCRACVVHPGCAIALPSLSRLLWRRSRSTAAGIAPPAPSRSGPALRTARCSG